MDVNKNRDELPGARSRPAIQAITGKFVKVLSSALALPERLMPLSRHELWILRHGKFYSREQDVRSGTEQN